MKVYVVTSGCYSDYRIEQIFTTKEKAEYFRRLLYDRENEIEEYELDPDFSEYEPPKGFDAFTVDCKNQQASTTSCIDFEEIIRIYNRSWGGDDLTYGVNLYAKDEKHALKSANEIVMQAKAMNLDEGRYTLNGVPKFQK